MFDVKPLRWSFIVSLPLFAAAIWLVFFTLAAVERSQRNAEFSEDVLRGSVKEATFAVRRMGRLTNPPIDLVVAAAASPSSTVAYEGQLVVDDMLRRWHRQLDAGRNVGSVARKLKHLAAALDEQRNSFSIADYAWLGETTSRIVELANRTSPGGAPGLAVHCDSLLALANTPVMTATIPATLATTTESDATQTQTPTIITPVEATTAAPITDGVFAPPARDALQTIVRANDAADEEVVVGERIATEPSEPATVWQGQWVRPLLSAVGITPPVTAAESSEPSTIEFASPHNVDIDVSPSEPAPLELAEDVSTRKLFERWLSASPHAVAAVELELAQRGFRSPPRKFVEMLFSDDSEVRVQLVDDVISTPTVDAKPWLLLLADDQSSDVRLSAVTVMATSNDLDLIEKAWQVALYDRDPRVSDLVERIRERRANLR